MSFLHERDYSIGFDDSAFSKVSDWLKCSSSNSLPHQKTINSLHNVYQLYHLLRRRRQRHIILSSMPNGDEIKPERRYHVVCEAELGNGSCVEVLQRAARESSGGASDRAFERNATFLHHDAIPRPQIDRIKREDSASPSHSER
ncbi:hypothetical protein WAI453_003369 [Rhynchosporium graminicola]